MDIAISENVKPLVMAAIKRGEYKALIPLSSGVVGYPNKSIELSELIIAKMESVGYSCYTHTIVNGFNEKFYMVVSW